MIHQLKLIVLLFFVKKYEHVFSIGDNIHIIYIYIFFPIYKHQINFISGLLIL